jgi:cytochrome c-type biogenesis protein CcmH/NrfF
VAALLSLLALAPAALACPKTSLTDLEEEVMCPVCGTPLASSPEAPQAKRQIAFMTRLIESCKSEDQVKAALVAEYGAEVLATPDNRGFDLAAWLVPAVALLGGAGGIGVAAARLRRRRRAAGAGPAMPPPPAADDAARLERDLARHGP